MILSVRLQKYLAEAGVASRRACEAIILEGRVQVNGKTVTLLGSKVEPMQDRVTLDGAQVRPKKKLYIALHKPRRYLCSRLDDGGGRVIADLLPKEWSNLFSVGRLDFDSEGLLFLTNDGEFSLKLTHPRYGVRKRYLANVDGKVLPEMTHRIVAGVSDMGEKLKAEGCWIIAANKSRSVVELEMAEGKNREVRRLFETQGLHVSRLVRTQIGKIKLGELPSGKWRALTEAEIKSLLGN